MSELFEFSQLDRIESKLDLLLKAKKKRTQTKAEYTPDFEQLWQPYPKRLGSNPKDKAFHAYKARLTECEYALADMRKGVTEYRAYCKSEGIIGTGLVMQASRFFGPSKEYLTDWTVPPDRGVPKSDEAAIKWGADRGINPAPGESMRDYRCRLEAAL